MTGKVESKADYGSSCEQWKEALKLAGDRQKDWEQRGDKIVKRYKDERSDAERGAKKFNILWSNVQTISPVIYNQIPTPVVARRFKDPDPISRAASDVLERALAYQLECFDFDSVMRYVVEDYLLPGRGISREFYQPSFMQNEAGEQEVAYEEVISKYHFWKDVRFGPARCWEDLPWMAFRNYMRRDQLQKRWPEEANSIPLNYKPDDVEDENAEQFKQAVVWEIWSKTENKVIWYAEGMTTLLEEGAPPLNLKDFWPTPKPLFSLITNDSLIPVPDYAQYQDQADELDRLTARIDKLVDAIKVIGFYAGEEKETLQQALSGEENMMIPVEDWAMFSDKGGANGAISYYPVQQVAAVAADLYNAREQTKQELYEITGLSDILRGASDSAETATAQRIKGQYASLRTGDRQKAVQYYARDLIRIKAEIIAEHFSMETLQTITGLQYEPEMWAAIMALLKNEALRGFRIDIETDSTIAVDEQAEKESRMEFVTTVSDAIEKASLVAQEAPDVLPLFGEMVLFAVRGFRTGREMEERVEETIDGIIQAQQQRSQMQEQPDPEVLEKQAEMQLKTQEAIANQQNTERELNQKDRELDLKERELALKEQEALAEAQFKQQDMAHNQEMAVRQQNGQAFEQGTAALSEQQQMLVQVTQQAMEAMAQSAEAVQQSTEAIAAIVEQNQGIAEALMAPKELVRDENGRPIGVKTAGTLQ